MTLRERQSLFARLVAELIQHAIALGYEVTLGEGWRSPEEAARLAKLGIGSKNSLHPLRLAQDLNLFLDGQWLRDTADHRPLGEWWEQQHPDCCWGGRWGDGNHYSMTHEGRA